MKVVNSPVYIAIATSVLSLSTTLFTITSTDSSSDGGGGGVTAKEGRVVVEGADNGEASPSNVGGESPPRGGDEGGNDGEDGDGGEKSPPCGRNGDGGEATVEETVA